MNRYSFILSVFIYFSFIGQHLAQNYYEEYSQNQLKLEGLNKNKESYIRDILRINASHLGTESLKSDLQALINLPGIADVKHQIDTFKGNLIHSFYFSERTTLLPIINFGGIEGNIWFQLGATENNFRGLGDTALAFYQNNNGRHTGQLFFKRPRIINSNWGYSASINSWSSQEPIFFAAGTEQFEYTNNAAGVSLLRNFGLFNRLEFGFTYFQESYIRSEGQNDIRLGPENFSVNKLLSKLKYVSNRIDYNYFYLKGIEHIFTYQNVYTFSDRSLFNSVQYVGRLFTRPKGRLNLAFRFKLAFSNNNDSPFAPFVADSHFNIRGIGNRIDRGTAQLIINAEARYTITHIKYWSLQLVAFSDSGTWRNPGGELSQLIELDEIRQFVGMGFRLNYQKVFGATLRVDYGVDICENDQRGLVIGLGQYF